MQTTAVETLTRAYEAWNRRDVDAGLEFVHPDVEWVPPPDSPFAGTYRGCGELRRFFASMLEAFEVLRREPVEYVERGDRIIVPVSSYVRGAGSGVGVDVSLIDVWQFSDGLVIRYEVHPDTPEVRAELDLPPRE